VRTKRNSCSKCIVLIGLILSFITMGCGTKPQPSVTLEGKSVKEKSVREPQEITAEKEEGINKEVVKYSYNPKGKKDPFKPFFSTAPVDKNKKRSGKLTPLQKYKLGQLKLAGIIWGIRSNIAMVEDSTSRGYILKRGTLVGENEGRVIKITKDKVIIKQIHTDYFGRIKTKRVSLKLHVEEGAAP